MKSILKKESPLWAIIVLPLIYLAYIWKQLPDQVPVHWNINGEVDRYGSSSELILMALLPLFVYLTFLIIPKIDPKKKLYKMGNKFQHLKIWFMIIMSMLSLYILYSAMHQSLVIHNYMLLIIGFLFIMLGNYFKTIQPNYFIGIRTPWTLENETVWKETHRLAGKIWFVGGILIVLASLILSKQLITYVFITTLVIMIAIPILYSYFKFEDIKNSRRLQQ